MAGFGLHRRRVRGPLMLGADGVEEFAVAIVQGLDVETGARSGERAFYEPWAARDRLSAWRERLLRGPRRHEIGLFWLTDALAPFFVAHRALQSHPRIIAGVFSFETAMAGNTLIMRETADPAYPG